MPEDDKYDVLEKIGHGSFGIIRKVKRKTDGYILCRKEISYSKMSQKEREQLQAELSILKELRHPNIVAYFEREHIKASQDLYLYMEYCGNGDLGRIIRDAKAKNTLVSEDFIWTILSQIVSALYRCHYGEDPPPPGDNILGSGLVTKPISRGKPMILHRDLKPENIFLGDNHSVKLGDFGLSKILQSHDFASTYVGTPFYMSPEICKAEQYTLYSDIWALGCIMYEMCAKQPPFNAKTHFELIQKIKVGNYPPIPSIYSRELNDVIANCLSVRPERRPDTIALLNDPRVRIALKEQEVVAVGKDLKEQKQKLEVMEREAVQKLAQIDQMRRDLDASLRREWEVKAQLEIKRQVSEQEKIRFAHLQQEFEKEVSRRVEMTLAKYPNRLSTSPRLAPRSSTPVVPTEQPTLFSSEPLEPIVVSASTSTSHTDFSIGSETDISSLSLHDDESKEEPAPKPVPAKRSARAPLSRARTYAAPTQVVPPSPMDVQMSEPSPAPASIAGLSLSPRRNPLRNNIFALAKNGAKKWEPEVPPSPSPEEWGDNFDDDDDLPALPSPTRARSGSGGRHVHEDPFKVLAAGQRPLVKPNQRLANAPNLAPNGVRSRPNTAVPVIATSPTRQNKNKSVDMSPTRKAVTSRLTEPTTSSGLKSKKGNEQIRIQALRNNGIQGRTIVELNRKERNPMPLATMSDDEGRRLKTGPRSPMKVRSANAHAMDVPAVWDPMVVDDMPSPFIQRSKRIIKA